jgi:cobalamin biosynthetic protein CobC
MTDRGTPPRSPRHGGDLDYATAVYGQPRDGWLDLSTGVNPHPYPVGGGDVAALHRLPSGSDLARLIAAARQAFAVAPPVALAATPGTEVALRLLPLLAPDGPVAIVTPTYVSHAEAWRATGRDVVTVHELGAVPPGVAAVVTGNPNNPDGRRSDRASLVQLGQRLAERGLLVVDEAFADLVPEASLVPHLEGLNAIVLRSFGKFFGLPGLRLGFAVGAPAMVARVASVIGDWPVSATALAIGTRAIADREWQEAMRARLGREAGRLREILTANRLAIRGGTDLFVLAEDSAGALHERLARQGIWTRAFTDEPTWVRFGLPGNDAEFARLERALSAG